MKRLLAFLALTACVQHVARTVGPSLDTVDHAPAFLKVHMKNGDLYVLDRWTPHDGEHYLEGDGVLRGTDRLVVEKSHFRIPFMDVALYETNTISNSPSIAGIAIVMGISIAIGTACVINPKACFGSCPTFYARARDGRSCCRPKASPIHRTALEDHDIDALWRTESTGDGPIVVHDERGVRDARRQGSRSPRRSTRRRRAGGDERESFLRCEALGTHHA